MSEAPELKRLPLDALWRDRAKKFGAFAGYDMPLEFEGLMVEHAWTRAHAGLFDVSHMGPCYYVLNSGTKYEPPKFREVAAFVEKVVPADIQSLKPGQTRYTTILNDQGGVIDDLMIARPKEMPAALFIVANASMKHRDFQILKEAAGDSGVALIPCTPGHIEPGQSESQGSLLALQGPEAAQVLQTLLPGVDRLDFMTQAQFVAKEFGSPIVSRSGYTGEDGFEISCLFPRGAQALAEAILADPRVKPIGLGARDSLRLEAGLCLYGHDLDETISPIEAGLAWTIQKRRREAGDFPGASRILRELKEGPARKRVGIKPLERAPAREGVEIFAGDKRIGIVTSGGFSPTLNAPISMGYVAPAFSKPGTRVELLVRGQKRPAEIVALPFVPHRYARKT